MRELNECKELHLFAVLGNAHDIHDIPDTYSLFCHEKRADYLGSRENICAVRFLSRNIDCGYELSRVYS